MKNILLLTFLILVSFSLSAQNGGGCAKAISIVAGTYKMDTMVRGAATFADYPPFPSRAKWYKYTPAADGLMTVTSCNNGSDTRLFLYTGACGSLTPFGFNDDACAKDSTGEEVAADASKFVKAGTTYYIEWDNAWDTTSFNFTLSFSSNFVAAATQTCQTATTVAPGSIKVDSLFGFSSRGDAARSNWYKYTPLRNGKISLSTCGVKVDTRLWVYKGTCAALVKIGESDDDCDDVAVAISNLTVTAGTTYYFEWDDAGENSPFRFEFIFDAATSVEDNFFANTINISPNPATDFVDLNVNFEKNEAFDVQIFNAVGQKVLSKKIDSILRGSEILDVTALKSGVYIVSFSDGERRTNKKLVVSR